MENPTKYQIDNINTYDKVASEAFNIESLGFRFNYNFRWFWAKSKTFYNFKRTLVGLPLEQAKIVTQIYLN